MRIRHRNSFSLLHFVFLTYDVFIMRSIDVNDLPDPVAEAIAAMVQTIRGQIAHGSQPDAQKRNVELPIWSGRPLGKLKRGEIYDDVG